MLKGLRLSNLYYPFVLLAYFLTLLIPSMRVGVAAAGFMVVILILLGLEAFNTEDIRNYATPMNICVLIYFVYNLLSFVWVIKNGFPVSVYIEEFSNSIMPIVFYFAAVCMSDTAKRDSFYRIFLCAFTVFSVISIALYLWAPKFYCDYCFNQGFISKADSATVRVRMESFMGSTTLSFLAVCAMIAAAYFILTYTKKVVLYSALLILAFITVFLANGRAGMVAAVLVILFLNWIIFFDFKYFPKKYLYIEIGAAAVLIIGMCVALPSVVHKVAARLVSLPGAVGQRSEQWISAINNMYGQWFGNGLGVNGHKAINIEGAHVVADGGIIKLYCEEGALGFSLFMYIVFLLIFKGVKDLKSNFAEIMIIAAALLMSIGSNIIAFQPCMPIFWFAAGVICVNTGEHVKRADNTENADDNPNIIRPDFQKGKNA